MFSIFSRSAIAGLFLLFFLSVLTSCNQGKAFPENDFSYLDQSEGIEKKVIVEEDSIPEPVLQVKEQRHFDCSRVNSELEGVLNKVEYFGAPGYGKTPAKDEVLSRHVLKLLKEIEVNCGEGRQLVAREIVLQIPTNFNFEHLIGGTVIVRGQLFTSGENMEQLPLAMRVLRMENIKPVMQ
jgi:hypothetical protein